MDRNFAGWTMPPSAPRALWAPVDPRRAGDVAAETIRKRWTNGKSTALS
jgi:hypothetical protein